MVKPTRTVIVGAGQIARQHAACLIGLEGVEVVAVCDLSRSKAEYMAERFAIDRSYTDYAQMLREISPDAVHVTTSPHSHYPIALAALEAGAHVFVEKPAVVAYEQLANLIACAQDRSLMLVEDHNYLFNPSVQKVMSMKKSGAFGDIRHVDIQFCVGLLGPSSPFADRNAQHPALCLPGGVIFDFLPHMTYLALALVGPLVLVDKLWLPTRPGSVLPCEEFKALLRHDSGAVTLGFSARSQPNLMSISVYGECGRAEINLLEPHLTMVRSREGSPAAAIFINGLGQALSQAKTTVLGLWQRIADTPGPYEGMWSLIGECHRAIRGEVPAPVSLGQIDASHRLISELTTNAPRL